MGNRQVRCIRGVGATKCRRTAWFFGRWAGGGLCLGHALALVREYGVDDFHAEYQAELTLLAADKTLTREVIFQAVEEARRRIIAGHSNPTTTDVLKEWGYH